MKIFAVALIAVVLFTLLGNFNAKKYGGTDNEDNEIEDNILETWKAPDHLKKKYPFYMSGYDKEGRPIWIFEFGEWDVTKLVNGGLLKTMEFDTYVDQLFSRVNESSNINHTTKDKKKALGWVCIVDFQKYSSWQLLSLSTVNYVKRLGEKFEMSAGNLNYGFLINLNYLAENLITLVRPVVGRSLGRAEIHGTKKAKWQRSILKRIPKYSLPKKYGGYANFTPIEK